MNSLQVSSGFQLRCVVKRQDGVAESCRQIAATLASLDDDFGNILEGLDHVLRLFDMDEADGSSDDAGRVCLALADEVTEFHEGGGGIAKGKQGIRMFLYSQTYACLSAGDAL